MSSKFYPGFLYFEFPLFFFNPIQTPFLCQSLKKTLTIQACYN